jgi:hypothetical protein
MRVVRMQFERIGSIRLTVGIRLGGGNLDHIAALIREMVGTVRCANREAIAHEDAFRTILLRHGVIETNTPEKC